MLPSRWLDGWTACPVRDYSIARYGIVIVDSNGLVGARGSHSHDLSHQYHTSLSEWTKGGKAAPCSGGEWEDYLLHEIS